MQRSGDGAADRLRTFMELAPVCMLLVGRDGVIRIANPEAANTFGWPVEELLGRSVDELVPEPNRAAHAAHRARFGKSPRARPMGSTSRLKARHRDGSVFAVDVMLMPLADVDGVFTVVIDRSELGRTEEALQRSTTMLRQVMEGVPDVLYVVRYSGDTLAGQVEMVSSHVKQVIGYEAREFIADPTLWFRSIHPDDVEMLATTTRQMIEQKVPVLRTYRMRHRDSGRWLILEDRAAPLLDDRGNVVASCGAARDVTGHGELQANLMMTERLAAIGTLAASVGHELSNPLTSIHLGLSYALELLETEPHQTAKAIVALRDSLESATRMGEILRDLTGLARRESTPGRVDPRRAADVAARLASATIRESAELVRRYDAVPEVIADETRLAQVLLNLLVNAAQAIPGGRRGTITLSTSTEVDRSAVIVVRDNGSGITDEHLPRLFEPFFTTKPRGAGTGLGLFVSKRIVDDLGGAIEVKSEVGVGTEVKVRIPAAS